MKFDEAVALIIDWEGGDKITDDPDDPGGLTKFGISQRAYPDLDIAALTEEKAKAIYYIDYWVASKADKLPAILRLAHFDASVQHPPRRANFLLQKALKVRVDGIVGPVTIKAAHDQGVAVLSYLLAHRALYYQRLVEMNPSNKRFIFGWLRRVSNVGLYTGASVVAWG